MGDILQQIMTHGVAILNSLAAQALKVVTYPLDPDQRIYVLYLASSLVLAGFVYSRHRAAASMTPAETSPSFTKFLFPDDIWSSPSAWLDVRYFFFHQMVRLVIYGSFMAGLIALGADWASTAATKLMSGGVATATETDLATHVILVVVTVVATDFTAFITHYYQHKLPVLWEFHKIHHSATVLHPLSNYREHPFDNVLYAISLAIAVGIVSLISSLVLGYVPALTIILGGGALTFLYNVLGYNLRHSHIWLRWPDPFPKVFGSPAHHQVHHSFHPNHIDKNFAFMFPVWDVIFNTYEMPHDNRDLRFGLGTGEEPEYRSVLGLYFLPFKKLYLRFTNKKNA